MEETDFILERSVDGNGWVLSHPGGDLMISWDHGNFIKSLEIGVAVVPLSLAERQLQSSIIKRMSDLLLSYHPELLIP